MKNADDLAQTTAAVRDLLKEKHGVRSRDLRGALQRTGRRLPRGLRRQGQVLLDAEKMAAVPKLSRQIDWAATRQAARDITRHLEQIDVSDRRKGRILGMMGLVAGQVLFVGVAFLVWLWWRGYV